MSNEQLMALASGGGQVKRPAVIDVKKLSNEELLKLASPQQTKPSGIGSLFARGADTKGAIEGLKRGAIQAIPLAGGLVGGGLGAAAGPVGAVAGAGLGAAAGKSLQSTIQGFVSPEEAPKTLSEGFKRAATEGAYGALGEGAGIAIGTAATGLGKVAAEKLSTVSKEKAVKAAGAMLKDMRRLFGKGKIEELGKTLLENDIVTPLSTTKDVVSRTSALARDTGAKLDELYTSVQSAIPKSEAVKAAGFRPMTDAKALVDSLTKELKGKVGSTTAINQLTTYLDEIAANGDDIPVSRVREIRQEVDDLINYQKRVGDLPTVQQGLHKIRTFINKKLADQADVVSSLTDTVSADELKRLNKLSSNLAEIGTIARDRVARDAANQAFGLSEKIAMGAGGVGGTLAGIGGGGIESAITGGASAIALGTIAKAIRTYGNAAVASATEVAAKMIQESPRLRVLAKTNPSIITQTALNLLVQRGEPIQQDEEAPQRVKIPAKPTVQVTPVQRRLLLRGQ